MNIKTFKVRFDPILANVVKARTQEYRDRCPDPFLASAIQHLHTLAMGGGKRIRPYIACASYEMMGKRLTRPVMELFTALELFHLFALIHDDIIDHGVERHGVPTLHRFIEDLLKQHKRQGDSPHVARGQAMLLGDFLHACANHILQKGIKADPRHLARVRTHFDVMVQEVMLGEAIDVDLATRREVTQTLIDCKMHLKTASYTFIRPMIMGVALAGGSRSMEQFCERFGKALGLAFQIQDDLLDLTASAETIHKTVFSDLREHQHTVFTQYIFEEGTRAQQAELRKLLGTNLAEADRPRVHRVFQESGAIDYGRSIMTDHFNEAEHALDELRLPEIRKRPLRELVAYIRARSY